MTIITDIVEQQYHGQIELLKSVYDEDEPGKGMTKFKISIPMVQLKQIAQESKR